MALYTWTEDMSVGVREFDEHHQKLILLINKLHDSATSSDNKAVIENVLAELANYTVYHFFAEEEAMYDSGYPEAKQHADEHLKLTEQTFELIHRFNNSQDVNLSEVLEFLIKWLKNHILFTDKKYSSFFNEKGIK